jgi:hypothetical protein
VKRESIARIILTISVIILLSTGIVLTPTEHLFPIFFLVAALNIVPLAIGSKKQRILALVVLLISVSLGIWSLWSLKHGKEIRQRVQELSEKARGHHKSSQTITLNLTNRLQWER